MLLTIKDVAQRLNVSQSCIYQLVETGKIPHHRIGTDRGAIRFTEVNIEGYLAATEEQGSAHSSSLSTQRQLKHLKL